MKFRFYSILFVITLFLSPLLFSLSPVLALGEEKQYIVSAEKLHLREGPGLTYPILDTLDRGDVLSFIDKRGDWLNVEVKGTKGWVASWLTKEASEESYGGQAISQVDRLNIRLEPSLSSAVLGQLNKGDQVQIIGQQDKWLRIQFQQLTGWVYSDYLSISETAKNESAEYSRNEKEEIATSEISSNLFTIAVDAVIVRSEPNLTSKELGIANKDEQYEIIAREQNWVNIKYNGKSGWLYSFYGDYHETSKAKQEDERSVTIIYNGTNLRAEPSTASKVLYTAMAGEQYQIIDVDGDWFKIKVSNNQKAYVASWVVSSTEKQSKKEQKKNRKKGTLNGVTIVLDPGHGGNDQGTSGLRGTIEKDVTLKTAELLRAKLRQAGAEVILTRESDVYVGLRKRVAISHQYPADAFISIHYDAIEDRTISGFTTYYYNSYQQSLAQYIHNGLSHHITIRDRGVQK